MRSTTGVAVAVTVLGLWGCNVDPFTTMVKADEGGGGGASAVSVGEGSGGDAGSSVGAGGAVTSCRMGSECASGFCSEGICCDAACDGSCVSCGQPGREGICSAIAAGTACGDGRCDAGGRCSLPTPSWSRSFGGSGTVFARSLARGPDGSLWLGGYCSDEVTFASTHSCGGFAAFVAPLGPDGTPAPEPFVSGDSAVRAVEAVATNASGDVFAGGLFKNALSLAGVTLNHPGTQHNGFVLALTEPTWGHVLAGIGGQREIVSLAVAPDGVVFAGGFFTGELADVTSVGDSAFVVALNGDAPLWTYADVVGGPSRAHDVAVDAQGDAWMVGDHEGSYWGRDVGTGRGGFVGRLDHGVVAASVSFGAVDAITEARAVGALKDGVVVAAYASQPFDVEGEPVGVEGGGLVVMAFDHDASLSWAQSFAATGAMTPRDLAADDGIVVVVGDAQGSLAVAGQTTTADPGHAQAFVVALASDGTPLWLASDGAVGSFDSAFGVVLEAGDPVLCGGASAPVFGSAAVPTGIDAFVARFGSL